jgi:hypothetical protein
VSTVLRPEYHKLTEAEREAIHAWVRNHGLDPADVPVDGIRFDAVAMQWVITVALRNANGSKYLDGDGELAVRYERRPAEPLLPWPSVKTEETP